MIHEVFPESKADRHEQLHKSTTIDRLNVILRLASLSHSRDVVGCRWQVNVFISSAAIAHLFSHLFLRVAANCWCFRA